MVRIVHIIVTCVALAACSSGNDGSNPGTNPINLTFEDISAQELNQLLSYDYVVYKHSLLVSSSADDIWFDIINNIGEIQFPCGSSSHEQNMALQVSNSSAELNLGVSVPQCNSSVASNVISYTLQGTETQTLELRELKLENDLGAVDLTGYNLFGPFSLTNHPLYLKQIYLQYNLLHQGNLTLFNQAAGQGSRVLSYSITASSNINNPCTFSSVQVDCTMTIIDGLNTSSGDHAVMAVFNFNNIDLSSVNNLISTQYLPAGSIDFTINNWTGKITLYGNNTRATFSASNGVDLAQGAL